MKNELTIQDLERQSRDQPIWVINTTGDHDLIPGVAEVVIQIPTGDGTTENIILPPTWLPVCLTDRLTRRQLLSTAVLRRYASDGLIRFISEEYAMALLNHPSAEDERREIEAQDVDLRRTNTAKSLENTPVVVTMADGSTNTGNTTEVKPIGTAIPKINMSAFSKNQSSEQTFDEWYESVKNYNSRAMMDAIKERRNFSRRDLLQLLKKPEVQTKHKIVSAIKRHLERRQSK